MPFRFSFSGGRFPLPVGMFFDSGEASRRWLQQVDSAVRRAGGRQGNFSAVCCGVFFRGSGEAGRGEKNIPEKISFATC